MGSVPFASERLLTLSWPREDLAEGDHLVKKRILTRNFDLLDFDLSFSKTQNVEKINFCCLNN